MSRPGSDTPDEDSLPAPEPGFDGLPLTRRQAVAGLALAAAGLGATPAAAQGQAPRPQPAPPAAPLPTIVPGQAFALSAAAPPGTVIGTLATTGPAATGFAITGGNTAEAIAISPLGTLQVAPGAALRPGTLALSVAARGTAGTTPPVRVAVELVAPEPFRAIAPLQLEGTGAPAGTVTSFAMPLAEGDMPAGASLAVLRGTTPLRSQATVLKRHADGSARHVLIALEQPAALADGARLDLRLAVGVAHPDPGPELDMAAALAGRRATVTIQPPGGGRAWTHDLVASLPSARWAHGPLLSQARVQAAVPAWAVGGVTSLRLFADVTLHKDGALGIDLSLRNDIAYVRSGGTARYAVTLAQDGRTTLAIPDVVHALYATLMRVQLPLTLPGGAPAPARPHIRHDAAYLAERARVCTNVDRRLGITAAVEAEFRNQMRAPEWTTPAFPGRGMSYSMGASGVRDDMGPITRAQLNWIADGHRTYKAFALGQSEASAGCPWNIWDPTGGPRRNGAWTNLVDRQTWTDARDRNFFPTTEGAATPWQITASHMPSCHFIPYLLTGKRAILDALLGQASWAMTSFSPEGGIRGRGWDPATGEGMIVNRGSQWRNHAWIYREILNAAYAAPPEEEPHPGYFDTIARGNMTWFVSRIPAYTAASGELAGHFRDSYGLGTPDDVYSYHTEYMLSSLIKAAWFGVPGAHEYLAWSINWHAGRLINEPVFSASNVLRFHLAFPNFAVRSWEALEVAQRPSLGPLPVPNWNITGEASFDCMPFVALNIAGLLDLFPDDARLARAWRWFQRHNVTEVPVMTPAAMSGRTSSRSVVPIGRTRAAVAPAVVPGQAMRIPEDAAPGQVAGVVRTAGGLATDYAITGGTGVGLFAIDDAGVVTVAQALADGATTHTLSVTAGNAAGRAAAVAVVIDLQRAAVTAPVIEPPPPLAIAANARPGSVIGTLALRGSPARLSLAGDREGRFVLDALGRVLVAKPLTGLAGQRFELQAEARNRAGSQARPITIEVQPPPAAPRLADATLEMVEGAAPGTVVGQVGNAGGPARFVLATGGGGRFTLGAETGEVAVALPLARVEAEAHRLTVRAANSTGEATATLEIRVQPAAWVHGQRGLEHTAALGLRRLRENYAGPLVRLARRRDGAEADIGMAGPDGHLDLRAALDFARGGATEVVTWYDQSPVPSHWRRDEAGRGPLLTGDDGMPFRLAPGPLRPALRFRDNRALMNPAFRLPGGRNFTILVAWRPEPRPAGTRIWAHLLTMQPDLRSHPGVPRLMVEPDGRASLQQPGQVGMINSTPGATPGTPLVLGVVNRGLGAENQLWWLNGATAHSHGSTMAYDFPTQSVGRLGQYGPGAGVDTALDGVVAEIFVTAGAAVGAEPLAAMGQALTAQLLR